MSEKHAILAAGGTGGHMFPAQSLAEELLSRGWKVTLTTDARGARYVGNFPKAVEIVELKSASFARGGAQKLLVPFHIARGTMSAMSLFRKSKPAIIIGFGGYPALPALTAAVLQRRPRLVHEQNAVLGRVNRAFQARVKKVACGLWPTLYAGENAVYVGNPVRAAVMAQMGAALPKGDALNLVVIGGSQASRALSEIVPKAVRLLPDSLRARLSVVHQARDEDHDMVKSQYEIAGVQAEISPFFSDIPERLSNAHFVISRAGASSIADLQIIGRGSILIPLPIATNDHQSFNAETLVKAGAALIYQERDLTAESLAREMAQILESRDTIETMAKAAHALAKPNAAKELADLLEANAGLG